MLPDGWKKIALGKMVTIQSGESPTNFNLMGTGKYPYVKVDDLNNCNKYQKLSRYYTNDSNNLVSSGSILFPKRGAAILNNKVRIAAVSLYMDSNMMSVSPNNHVLNSEFLYYVVIHEKLYKIADTSTIPQINNKHIIPYVIYVPPLPEQHKIAAILSAWDEAIEKLGRLIEGKEKRLSFYGQQLFNPINGAERSGWKVVRLSEVLCEHGDLSTGKEKVFSVSVHKGLVNQIEHLGRSFSAQNTSNYNRVHFGDIVYTKSPTGDFPLGIVKQSRVDEDVIVSPLYGVFSPQTEELGIILDFYFDSPVNAKNYLYPIIQKGAKNTINITNKTFLSAKLNLPLLLDDQKKIAGLVNTFRQEIHLLKKIAEKYKEQKRGLMQKLLTGEWRVKVSEEAI